MIDELVVPSSQFHFKLMKQGALPYDLTIENHIRKYEVHAIVLSANSKKILKIMSSDPKRKEIQLDYPDESDVLSQVIDYCYGFDLSINPANYELVYLISTDLAIPELQTPSQEILEKSFTTQTVIPSLYFIYQAKGDISPHIRFIQQNFNEMMYQEQVIALPFEILEQIISTDELNVEDENALAFWVSKVIMDRGESCVGLIKCLNLADLSDQTQLELCKRQEVDAHALLDDVKKAKQNPNQPKRRYLAPQIEVDTLIQTNNQLTIEIPEDKSVKGILDYILSHQKAGISEIRLEVSSTHYKYFLPKNLLELSNQHSCWYSGDEPNQWVIYDFSPRKININAYTLRTSGGNKGQGHLKSWRVTASNDGRKWTHIDERQNVIELNSNYAAMSFKCKSPGFFRLIKITQIDVNHHNDYYFILSCCEFFGQIVPKDIE